MNNNVGYELSRRLYPPRPMLKVRNLSKYFGPRCKVCITAPPNSAGNKCSQCGTVTAFADVSFAVGAGETLGIVGESGSGKSSLLNALFMQLEPDEGVVEIDGVGDIFRGPLPSHSLRRRTLAMVHQNSLVAGLRPHISAEANVAEKLLQTGLRNFEEIHRRSGALLTELGIPQQRHKDLLSTFSGGMAQRVQLARTLVDPPAVLLLDEPTTGLDLSVQADLLLEIKRTSRQLRSATVLVSHDMAVINLLADYVAVLRHGMVVERGVPEQIFNNPQHPYTQQLIASRI